MRIKARALCAVALAMALGSAQAALIAIDHYDINDAVLSGHGNWQHTYGGTITPGTPFFQNGQFGTTASYFGGSGIPLFAG